jgi:hypothetical protein
MSSVLVSNPLVCKIVVPVCVNFLICGFFGLLHRKFRILVPSRMLSKRSFIFLRLRCQTWALFLEEEEEEDCQERQAPFIWAASMYYQIMYQ